MYRIDAQILHSSYFLSRYLLGKTPNSGFDCEMLGDMFLTNA